MKSRFMISVLMALTLLTGCGNRKGMPALTETYSRKDSRPYGGQIAWRMLQHAYPGIELEESRVSFTSAYQKKLKDSNSVYLCLSQQFLVEEEDVSSILDYVYQGNTFFLSSSNIDTVFLNKLYCTVAPTQMAEWPFPKNLGNTSLSVLETEEGDEGRYGYFYLPFLRHFSELNEYYCRVLGYNQEGEANAIVFFWGKGRMFIHTDPRSFSNYFLLTGNNRQYWLNYLQLMNREPDQVVWDSYYQNRKRKTETRNFSSLSEIMKHPALGTAFWLVLLLLLLYILFGGKRKQRIIREIPPNVNSSVAFTETIARLYLQKKDNKNIADKMIMYFNEFIRTHYFLPVNPGSSDFADALSRKSGVPFNQVDSLYRAVEQVSKQTVVSDFELLSLNEQIQQFYKNRK